MKSVRVLDLIGAVLVSGLTACVGLAPLARHPASESAPSVRDFPELVKSDPKYQAVIHDALKTSTGVVTPYQLQALAHYVSFLGISANDLRKGPAPSAVARAAAQAAKSPTPPTSDPSDGEAGDEEGGDKIPSNLKAFGRLLNASTQFILCDDLRDWGCLEKLPEIKPAQKCRQEPQKSELGSIIDTQEPQLDLEIFFTELWDLGEKSQATDIQNAISHNKNLASRLADKLEAFPSDKLSLAIYGIDDIGENGTMRRVYDDILEHNPNVRAVVDVVSAESHTKGSPPWPLSWTGEHMTFEYDGTTTLLKDLNAGITRAENTRARLESPFSNIMHNKFVVFENVGDLGATPEAVWAGTANLSNHCMGSERNANTSVFVKSAAIARAYRDEFDHMFNFAPGLAPSPAFATAPIGRFHVNKRPVSHRLFRYGDGTLARVHFAPTDDAEHRVILPMILSAQKGDTIRVAMFGGTGYEIVRAFQYAASRGAKIKIAFDRRLGAGRSSWACDPVANLLQPNPYSKDATPIEVKFSKWAGKNHNKAGTLTRESGTVEEFIVGSQNWSSGGNDANDENLISVQNLTSGVQAGEVFNREFDVRLWDKSGPPHCPVPKPPKPSLPVTPPVE